jgi:ribosomal protein S8
VGLAKNLKTTYGQMKILKKFGFARSFHRTDQVLSPQLGAFRAQKLTKKAKKAKNVTVTLWYIQVDDSFFLLGQHKISAAKSSFAPSYFEIVRFFSKY